MNSPGCPSDTSCTPRHANNVGTLACNSLSAYRTMRDNSKNVHAVALGHMTSEKKAAAAQKNGAKGGRPSG